jgi:soluble lytic murein transglycosylase-like protein
MKARRAREDRFRMRLLIALALTTAAILMAPTITGSGATPLGIWTAATMVPEQFDLRPTLPQPDVAIPNPSEILGEVEKSLSDPLAEVPVDVICERLTDAAQSSGLPAPFFARLIWQESKFNPRAVSPVGAQGVAQFMPRVASAMGLDNPFDPLAALPTSAHLLRTHYRTFGNLGLAAAAYNAGPKRVLDWLARRGKLPDETRNYVRNITGQPAERWLVEKPVEISYKLPNRAPCHGIGGLSREARAETVAVQLEAPIAKVIADAKAAEERARKIRAARALKTAKAANEAKAKAAKAKQLIADKAKAREHVTAKGKVQDRVPGKTEKVASASR